YVNKIDEVDDDILLINGRVVLSEETWEKIRTLCEKNEDIAIMKNENIIALKFKEKIMRERGSLFLKPVSSKIISELNLTTYSLDNVFILNYPWDIVLTNTELLKEDISKEYSGREIEGEIDPNVTIYGDPKNLYVAKDASIEAYTVIDVRHGPIYIGEKTIIQPGCRIEGPTYIGKDTRIIGGAQLREGSNIGDVCRVGGEFEEAVMHGYSNKYHAGFIGHAYIGEWVNIGAMTTNSDLKDTYGTVKVVLRGKKIDTGSIKVGSFIGDMTKTSIGVLIYTGKVIGVSAHLHGLIWENVPSFTIYAKSLGAEPVELYLDSVITTHRRVKGRRKKELPQCEIDLIRKIFELTEEERRQAGVKKGRFKLG
ncbi:MAG TPA: hypothetical protein ENG40_02405, partial [Thermoprotei archaeon]|nr:hypothetical protein [Thermoprotei archaeon]